MDNQPDQLDNWFNSIDLSKLCESISHEKVTAILNSTTTLLSPVLEGYMAAWIESFLSMLNLLLSLIFL